MRSLAARLLAGCERMEALGTGGAEGKGGNVERK